ncbi:MAG: glycosyltransferase family 2 protein [Lactococcus sp.]|nr:glycosyltransferase family 2 protein [Lactococcus sp.]
MNAIDIVQEYEKFDYDLTNRGWQKEIASFKLSCSSAINQTPKVSIVIANYNNATYLDRMMTSLVNQTIGIEQLQVMFIDDKSTDNSIDVIKPYLTNYPNIEMYILDENTGGAHGPRNVGLVHARGEYLVILDADDWYDEDALKYMSDMLDASGDDFGVSGIIQSVDGKLSLKSKPYFMDGDFKNRSIQALPAEFYGWLGPQGIMVSRKVVIDNNLHFVNQRVADDVTFFYEAMRFSKTISQGKALTTYLNRDADNAGLSKAINRTFMISWLRALSYINDMFPDDISKERFLSRRIEWLIHDFCLKRNIGYKYSKTRLRDFKANLDFYIGRLSFDPSRHFRNDFRKSVWRYLEKNDINGLYRFIFLFSVRWVLNKKLGMKTVVAYTYFYPLLLSSLPQTRLDVYAVAKELSQNTLHLEVYSFKKLVGFECRQLKQPYLSRQELAYKQVAENCYQVQLPEGFVYETNQFAVTFDDYSEIGVKGLKKLVG